MKKSDNLGGGENFLTHTVHRVQYNKDQLSQLHLHRVQ